MYIICRSFRERRTNLSFYANFVLPFHLFQTLFFLSFNLKKLLFFKGTMYILQVTQFPFIKKCRYLQRCLSCSHKNPLISPPPQAMPVSQTEFSDTSSAAYSNVPGLIPGYLHAVPVRLLESHF